MATSHALDSKQSYKARQFRCRIGIHPANGKPSEHLDMLLYAVRALTNEQNPLPACIGIMNWIVWHQSYRMHQICIRPINQCVLPGLSISIRPIFSSSKKVHTFHVLHITSTWYGPLDGHHMCMSYQISSDLRPDSKVLKHGYQKNVRTQLREWSMLPTKCWLIHPWSVFSHLTSSQRWYPKVPPNQTP